MSEQAQKSYTVEFEQMDDGEWLVTSPDIIGLVVYGKLLSEAMAEFAAVTPELMQLNGQLEPDR